MAHGKGQFYRDKDREGDRGNERGEMNFIVGESAALNRRFERDGQTVKETHVGWGRGTGTEEGDPLKEEACCIGITGSGSSLTSRLSAQLE